MERAKYRKQFPNARMHHMHPTSRDGDDQEFNLFPWNEQSHSAWHQLFADLTVQEVWLITERAWLALWDTQARECSATWLSDFTSQFNKGTRAYYARVRRIEWWRERWLRTFGSESLNRTRCHLFSMMLCMAFGHHAFSDEIFDNDTLDQLLNEIPETGNRAWAFRVCFGKPPSNVSRNCVRKRISKIRECTQHVRR